MMNIRSAACGCGLLVAACVLATGCASTPKPDKPLRVGVSADYPPVVYVDNDEIVGLEVDFATMVGDALGRPVTFVPMAFDSLFDKLESGDIDVAMSGITRTEARSRRVLFTKPYMTVALSPLVRLADVGLYTRELDVKKAPVVVAAEKGTTAAEYTRVYCFAAKQKTSVSLLDAPKALRDGIIDLYVHDAPAAKWLASASPETLAVPDVVLMRQDLAWAVNKRDKTLVRKLNELIARWGKSGQLSAPLQRWVPDSLGGAQVAAKVAGLDKGILFIGFQHNETAPKVDCDVLVDGQLRGTHPLSSPSWMACYLKPGDHAVTIRAPGYQTRELNERIGEGQALWRKVKMEAAGAPASAAAVATAVDQAPQDK